MKPAPTNPNGRNTTRNINSGNIHEYENSLRLKAIELSKTDFPHLKLKPIKYDLKR
jgi:hypothetical protein